MIRLHITAEGHAEELFARTVLALHLGKYDVCADARRVLTSKDNRMSIEYRGGLLSYRKARNDIQTWLKEDNHPECRFTTMFDLYALPCDFPGYAEAQKRSDPYQRAKLLEDAWASDINDRRFLPYIQLHEFEALILSDPQQLDWEYLEHSGPITKLVAMVRGKNPELINDGATTAPSKRILDEIPEYDKVTAGVAVAERIGLRTLRAECRHFNEWLCALERLSEATPE